jgi:hypothetical protein
METTLHRQLKERYLTDGAAVEQRVGRYRIDVARRGWTRRRTAVEPEARAAA